MFTVDDTSKTMALRPARHIYARASFGTLKDHVWTIDRTYLGTANFKSAQISCGDKSGGIGIGRTYCAKLTLTLVGDVVVNQTDMVQITVGFTPDDGTDVYRIRLGTFFVDKIKRSGKETIITAFDKMLLAEKRFISALTYPCATSDLLAELLDKMKVTLADGILPLDYDPTIKTPPVRGTDSSGNKVYFTRREVLGFIGSLLGGNWQHRGDGTLYLSTFGSLGAADGMSAENITKSEIDGDVFTVTDVVWSDGDYSKADDDVQGVIEFTNPLDVEREGVLEQLRAKLIGKSYHGGTIHRQGAGWYELGDIVTAAQKSGDPLPILISGIDYTISGGAFTERDYSSALSNSESNYTISDSYAQSSSGGSGGSGAGTLTEYTVLSDTSVKYNGITYTAELADSGLISKITDDKGGAFEPTFADVSNIAMHNAAFMAVAMLSGLKHDTGDDPLTPMCAYRYNCDKMTQDGANVNWQNQGSGGDISLAFTGATLSDKSVFVQGTSSSRGLISGAQSFAGYTLYLVAKCNVGADRTINAGPNIGGGSGCWAANAAVNTSAYVSTIPSTALAAVVLRGVSGGTVSLFINGSYVANLPTGTQATQTQIWFGSTLGGYFDGAGYTFCDFALSGAAHSDDDIIANSRYLMQKYNITGG